MPYSSDSELPEGVRNSLPGEAQSTWRRIFNSAYQQYHDDAKAAQVAWSGLKDAGWSKNDKGEWVSKILNWEAYVEVSKLDDVQQVVYGWGSVTKVGGQPYTDTQKDIVEDRELEKAVIEFMKAPLHDEMHRRIVPSSRFVQSLVVTDDILKAMFPGSPPPVGKRGWFVGIHIPDKEVYRKHKEGIYKGFSITGTATRLEVG